MAFFKFRWPGRAEQPSDKPARRPRTPQTETVEAMRRRARHRLIGAAVLVLVGVVGFPLLFDTQPRPVAVDIPIVIPDRNKVAPLLIPAAQDPVVAANSALPRAQDPSGGRAPPVRGVSGSNGLAEGEELIQGPRSAASKPEAISPTGMAAKTEVKTERKPDVSPELRAESKPDPKPTVSAPVNPKTARPDEAARARALLEDRPVAAAPGSPAAVSQDSRFIVQVGAFADADKVREVRAKVEGAGLKTYTQVVDTKDGKRTRVRIGPFASRAEAESAVGRMKALDLPASILTL